MATNLSIDPELIERALEVSGERTKKAAVTRALEEFILRRKQKRLLDLMGKLECGGQTDALCSTRDDGNLARESLGGRHAQILGGVGSESKGPTDVQDR